MLYNTFDHLPVADLAVTMHFNYYHIFYFVSKGLYYFFVIFFFVLCTELSLLTSVLLDHPV